MPDYNRYTQIGNDPQGYKTGSQDGVTGEEKGWQALVFQPGAGVQTPELNELQSILHKSIKDVGDFIRRDGQTQGLKLVLDLSGLVKTASIEWENPDEPGQVYYQGYFLRVPESTLTISGSGSETIGLQVTSSLVTGLQDPTLYDPIANERNHGLPGASRLVFTVTPIVLTSENASQYPNALELYFLQSGELASSSNDILNQVDQRLVSYTSDVSGDCLIRGMAVRVEDESESELRVLVDRGRAYVQGFPTGYGTTQALVVPKAKADVKVVTGELVRTTIALASGGVPELNKSYAPINTPIAAVTRFVALTGIRKRGPKNTTPFSINPLDSAEIFISVDAPYGPLVSVVSVYDVVGGTFVSFTQTPQGFRFNSAVPAGDIRVVWVFNGTLQLDLDFEINRAIGNVTTDRRSLTLLREYPESLDNLGALNGGLGDAAQFVYPGIASVNSTASVTGGTTDLLSVESTYGMVPGQRLYIGGTTLGALNAGTDEQVLIAEIVSGTQLRMSANIVSTHASGSYVYSNVNFADLRIDDNDFQMQVDYNWYLDRIDVLYLDKDNNYRIQTGQSNKPAFAPSVPPDVLPLVRLNISANADAANVVVSSYPVKHQTQQELRKLREDVDNQAYNNAQLALSLETYTKSSVLGLGALRGVLVDAFVNSNVADINQSPAAVNAVSIDPERGTLSVQVGRAEVPLSLDTTFMSSNLAAARVGTRSATLGVLAGFNNIVAEASTPISGVQEVAIAVPIRSTPVVNVVEGHFTGVPDRPLTFPFYNELGRRDEVVSRALEGGFWRARATQQPWLGRLSKFLPAQNLTVAATDLDPAKLYEVTIDGQRIGDFALYTRIQFTGTPIGGDAVTVTVNAAAATSYTWQSGQTAVTFAQGLRNHLTSQPTGTDYVFTVGSDGTMGYIDVHAKVSAAVPPGSVAVVRNGTGVGSTMAVATVAMNPISGTGAAQSVFAVPALLVSGVNARSLRVVEIAGAQRVVVAETLFGAEAAEVQRLPVAHDALAASTAPPVLQTFQVTTDLLLSKLELFPSTVGASGTMTVALMECDDAGVPNGRLLARQVKTVNPGVSLVTVDFTSAGSDLPALQAGRFYAVIVLGVTTAISLRGISNQIGTARAIAAGNLTTSTDGISKTVSSTSSLMMRMYSAVFEVNRNRIKFAATSVPTNGEGIATFNALLARGQQLVFRTTNIKWSYSLDDNVAEFDLPLDEFGTLNPTLLPQSANTFTLYATLTSATGQLSPQVGVKTVRAVVLEPKLEGVYVTRAVEGMATTYHDARVTLQALTAAGPAGITVKMTGYDDPYGLGSFVLSGVPKYGDVLTINILGTSYTFTFSNDALGETLSRLATRLAAFLSGTAPVVASSTTVASTRRIDVRLTSGNALVATELSLSSTLDGASTLAISAVSFNYITLTRNSNGTPIDDQFTEWTYDGEDVPQAGGARTLRVKLELDRGSMTNYTTLRRLAAVVYS